MTSTAAPFVAYVVGFAIDSWNRTAVIRKNRPAWQAGRVNGIGGKVEAGETPVEAMRREFAEETGVDVDGWEAYAEIRFDGGVVTVLRAFVEPDVLSGVVSATDELVMVRTVPAVLADPRIIPNLSWLLPLAAYRHDRYELVVATEVRPGQ